MTGVFHGDGWQRQHLQGHRLHLQRLARAPQSSAPGVQALQQHGRLPLTAEMRLRHGGLSDGAGHLPRSRALGRYPPRGSATELCCASLNPRVAHTCLRHLSAQSRDVLMRPVRSPRSWLHKKVQRRPHQAWWGAREPHECARHGVPLFRCSFSWACAPFCLEMGRTCLGTSHLLGGVEYLRRIIAATDRYFITQSGQV